MRTAAGGGGKVEGVVSGSALVLDSDFVFVFEDLDLVEGRSMVYLVVMRVCFFVSSGFRVGKGGEDVRLMDEL